MIQSSRWNNFEVVVAATPSGFRHAWRNNGLSGLPWLWSATVDAPEDTVFFEIERELSLVDSVVGDDLEAFALVRKVFTGGGEVRSVPTYLVYEFARGLDGMWRQRPILEQTDRPVHDPLFSGSPAVTVSPFGQRGNYELVIPLERGGLRHYYRDNDDPARRWHGHTDFAVSLGRTDVAAVIASNFGGNLEVVVRRGNELFHIWRDSPSFSWSPPSQITDSNIALTGIGTHALIQSTFGRRGNFELIVPSVSGGLDHWWRDNDDPSFPWRKAGNFGSHLGHLDAVALIQSNFGRGNLEVLARTGDDLFHFYKEPSSWWQQPVNASVLRRWAT